MESYTKALELDRSLTAAHLNMGILLSRQGKYAEAKSELLRTIELNPRYAKAYYNLGLVYTEEAVNDSALDMMDKAIELDGDYDLAKLGKAGICYEMARFDVAESLLVSLRENPSLGQQSKRQIDALLTTLPLRKAWMGNRRSAGERLSDRHLLRGDNLLAIGLMDKALEAYAMAIEADARSSVALYQAGTVYFNSGRLDEALQHFDRALQVAPSLKGAHFATGVIAFRKGDIQTACSEFEHELTIDPRSSASHINLAMCYEEHIKDVHRAVYHIEKYIELTGGTEEIRNHLKELKESLTYEGQ
jgi:superkiller protein 3